MKTILFALVLSLLVVAMPLADQPNYKGHAISMYGDLKYGPDFKHFDYANPNAPRGGTVKMSAGGTYDCLNQFILKGVSAYALGLIYDSLTERSLDESFSEYGLLAETIEVPPDRSWALFTLRAGARWHDGKPITPEDVVFTFETLQTKGHPFYRNYYADIKQIEKVDERQVKFTFGGKDNRELPLIVGQMAILPKHYWEGKNFEETTLEPPLGSGPYKIEAYDPGRSITYRRIENYWGADLPVKKGRYNPDVIHYDYYKDSTVATEAQKGGEFDFALQNNSKSWATAYDIPAVAEGRLIKELIPHENGTGMQGFWFNTRRNKFADPKVRHALAHAFDFEWTNTNLFYGQYARSTSYFSNTELASSGLPQGQELEILEAFRGQIPEEVFTAEYKPPTTDGSGNIRQNLRIAARMLKANGWSVKDGKLTNDASGETMIIEFLINNSPAWERIVGPYIQNLERLGVEAAIKIVDTSQYQNRIQEYDFDVIVSSRGQSLSPGNEQRGYWTSAAADESGTRNYAGIKDPVVDALVDQLINAPDRKTLVATTRALDRALLWGHYVVPHWHIRAHRVVYWNKFGKPDISPQVHAAARAVLPRYMVGRCRKRRGLKEKLSTMGSYILRRFLLFFPTLLGVMVINFLIIQAAPGGPVEQAIAQIQGHEVDASARVSGDGGELSSSQTQRQRSEGSTSKYRGAQGLDPELIAELERMYGFDKPAHERFYQMIVRYLQFDFGESFYRDQTVVDIVLDKMPVSISLGLWTTLLVYLISIPLGVTKAVRDGSKFDVWTSGVIVIGNAVPGFMFAIFLIVLFAGGSYFDFFPLRGLTSPEWDQFGLFHKIIDYFWHLALPIASMVIGGFAGLTLLTKNSFLDEINKQYVMTARAKGLEERRVLYGHVFRNAMLIVIAGFPSAFVNILFTGSLLTEIIFSLDGLGLLGYEATVNRDYPIMFATLYFFTLLGLVMQLVSDLTYTLVDPRIDFESREV